MRLLCALGRHRPSPRVIPNEGRLFSRCTACKADLILVGHVWRTAPRGYKVIWKDQDQPVQAADDAPAGEQAAEAPVGKRKRTDRRSPVKKPLPTKLGGKERRRSKDRRNGFGKRPDL